MSKSKFSPGDNVFVKNWGGAYTTFSNWFVSRIKNPDFNPEWAVRYAYNDESNYKQCCRNDNRKYRVLYVSDATPGECTKALIEEVGLAPFRASNVYLIDVDELVGDVKRVTMRDIEKRFGCKIEIIAEKEDE